MDEAKVKAAKMKLADELYDAVEAGDMVGKGALVGAATFSIKGARDGVAQPLKGIEKMIAAEAKKLPVYAAFVEPLNGMGALGLGQIIGEAGDLSVYANPAKLWKRMGLAVINGERQRKCTDAKKAIEHGYSPNRRSIMFVIGDSLIKKQNAYRELYLARKIVEEGKVPTDAKGTKALWHNRAKRYMEKRLLRNLWRAWRGQTGEPTA